MYEILTRLPYWYGAESLQVLLCFYFISTRYLSFLDCKSFWILCHIPMESLKISWIYFYVFRGILTEFGNGNGVLRLDN